MKRPILFCLLILCWKLSMGQFYDRTWLMGSVTMEALTFDPNTVIAAPFHQNTALTIVSASSNISDTNGNILFYCNGVTVGNSMGNIMDNGDTLTDSLFYSNFVGGFTEQQTNIILPKSGNTFYLFYYSESDSLVATNTVEQADRLYYAVIDMDANGGLGRVVSKKNLAYKGLFGDGRLTACRHANGKDWWLVHQGYENDEYFIYRVTPDSVCAPMIQQIGASDFLADNLGAQSVFSPDGSKFATISAIGPLEIMNFDRCNGLFSKPDSVLIPIDTFYYNGSIDDGTWSGGSACCFSASGRFVYINNNAYIYQYDTWATDVMHSGVIIGSWDSIGPIGGDLFFDQMYLLPNGQIIIEDLQGAGTSFHLIDSPDVQGVGCHFVFNGLPANTLNAAALPNMINYRLGALIGSGCDTLTGIQAISSQTYIVKVYPNPANESVQVDLSNRDLSEPVSFVVYDMVGQEIMRRSVPFYEIQVYRNNITSGIYTWQVQTTTGQTKASGKLVWE